MKYRFLIFTIALILGFLAVTHTASAISYCGRGYEQVSNGGIPGSTVSITLSATSGGVPVSDGAVVTNSQLVVSGRVTAPIIGNSTFCSDSSRNCYWWGSGSCVTYDHAEVNSIRIGAPSGVTFCGGSQYCSAKQSGDGQWRNYSRTITLVPGANTINVSGRNSYYSGLRVDCSEYGLGSTCTLGKGPTNSFKRMTVTYASSPPTGTITTITSPRSTVLTSVGQPLGTIAGTVSGGTGSGYAVQTVIRRSGGAPCYDWVSGAWTTTCSVSSPPAVVSGNTWTLSGTSVPPASAMTSGQTYRVYLRVRDSSAVWTAWIGTPLILYQLPTGTITTITSPRSTVLTSVGQPLGTITGTVAGGTGSGYAVQTVIRRGSGATCNDWVSGAWSTTCAASVPPAVVSGNTWTLSGNSVPPASAMTSGQTYRVYLRVRDGSGTWNSWIGTPLILYQLPTGTITTITSPRSTVLTSVGQPLRTIAGTVSGGTGSGYAVQTVIRRGSGATCNDWISGAWSTTCGVSVPPAVVSGNTWTLSGTSVPPASAMTSGQTYRVYLRVRDSSSAWTSWISTPLILYQLPPPTVTILSVDQPDYCQFGPDATVTWEFTSTGGLTQGAWRMQVASDPAFASIVYDSGRVVASAPMGRVHAFVSRTWEAFLSLLGLNEEAHAATSEHSASIGPGVLQFASSYYVRVRVWDSDDQPSLGWSGVQLFSTASGPYPQAQFTFNPPNPAAGQEVQFTDGSSGNPTSWLWSFGDGGTATDQNPTYTYAASGSYTITLDTTNAYGSCQATRDIGLQEALPQFKEVAP